MSVAISKQTISNTLIDAGVPYDSIELPDEYYALPAEDWVAGDFSTGFEDKLRSLGLTGYQDGKWNCNKFQESAKDYADECHALTPNAPDNSALCFGNFRYTRDDGTGGHGINVFVSNVEKPKVCFFEPQTGKLVLLSQKEINSCESCYF
jgi:hypothetical protein